MMSDIEASVLPLQPTCTSLPREIETVCQRRQKTSDILCRWRAEKGIFILDRRVGQKVFIFPSLNFSKITRYLVHYMFSFTYDIYRDSVMVDL
jgi:hypothetical protein